MLLPVTELVFLGGIMDWGLSVRAAAQVHAKSWKGLHIFQHIAKSGIGPSQCRKNEMAMLEPFNQMLIFTQKE